MCDELRVRAEQRVARRTGGARLGRGTLPVPVRVRLLVLPGLVLGLACGASDEDQEIPPGEGGGVVFPGFAQAAGGANALGMGGAAGTAGKAGGGGIAGAGGASGASGAGASGKAGGSGASGASGTSGKAGAAGASGASGKGGASGASGGAGGAGASGKGGGGAGGSGGGAGGASGVGGASSGAGGGAGGAKTCPPSTKAVGGGCYFLVTTPLARDAADAACDAQIKGARLASFASKAAQDAVTAPSGLKPQGTDYWMGLGCATHDAACNTISLSVWRWPDGAMPAYADWNETPNDASGCARLYRAQATGAFAWRDRPCDSQYGAVCQVP